MMLNKLANFEQRSKKQIHKDYAKLYLLFVLVSSGYLPPFSLQRDSKIIIIQNMLLFTFVIVVVTTKSSTSIASIQNNTLTGQRSIYLSVVFGQFILNLIWPQNLHRMDAIEADVQSLNHQRLCNSRLLTPSLHLSSISV